MTYVTQVTQFTETYLHSMSNHNCSIMPDTAEVPRPFPYVIPTPDDRFFGDNRFKNQTRETPLAGTSVPNRGKKRSSVLRQNTVSRLGRIDLSIHQSKKQSHFLELTRYFLSITSVFSLLTDDDFMSIIYSVTY